MKVTSWYSIFATNKLGELIERFKKSGALTVAHHFENEIFEYCVMKDASGNSTDFIQFKNRQVEEGFFALRMNTDDWDAMVATLISNGYELQNAMLDTISNKQGLFKSSNGEPNIFLMYHKK